MIWLYTHMLYQFIFFTQKRLTGNLNLASFRAGQLVILEAIFRLVPNCVHSDWTMLKWVSPPLRWIHFHAFVHSIMHESELCRGWLAKAGQGEECETNDYVHVRAKRSRLLTAKALHRWYNYENFTNMLPPSLSNLICDLKVVRSPSTNLQWS